MSVTIPRTPKRKGESATLRQIMLRLGREPDVLVLRNNVGRAVYVGPDGNEWTVPYGLGIGSPDLVCFLMRERGGLPSNACFGVEVKRPGEQPSADQLACHAMWRRYGVNVYVCHSTEEAAAALTAERARG